MNLSILSGTGTFSKMLALCSRHPSKEDSFFSADDLSVLFNCNFKVYIGGIGDVNMVLVCLLS